MLIITITVTICLLISLYINFNLYSKNDVLEEQVNNINKIETQAVDLVENLLLTYIKVLTRLKRVDSKGSFESDDEIGFVFKAIKTTIEDLKIELENLKKVLTTNETEK